MPLPAQICDGFPSLRERHFRAAASAAWYTYATALTASVASGKAIYGVVSVGTTRNSELDASTFDVGIEAGAEIQFNAARRVFLCPVAAYRQSYGPNDFLLTGENYRYTDRQIGLTLAGVPLQGRHLTIVVAGGLRMSALTTTRSGWPTVNNTYRQWILNLGVALDGEFTVRPSVTIPSGFVSPGARTDYAVPFGREGGEIGFGISVGVSFGGRRSSAP